MGHCGKFMPTALTRREMLARCASGFGGVALLGLMSQRAFGSLVHSGAGPSAVLPPHYSPRARQVIFLYMDGGPSQVDTLSEAAVGSGAREAVRDENGADPVQQQREHPAEPVGV